MILLFTDKVAIRDFVADVRNFNVFSGLIVAAQFKDQGSDMRRDSLSGDLTNDL